MIQNLFAAVASQPLVSDPLYSHQSQTPDAGAAAAILVIMLVVYVPLIALIIAPYWRIFTKAGEKGWKVLIPFYNLYVSLKLVGKPGWWLILLCIPVLNIPFLVILAHQYSKAFGHGAWLTLLYFLGFGTFVMAYSHDQFTSPSNQNNQTADLPYPQQAPAPTPTQPPLVG